MNRVMASLVMASLALGLASPADARPRCARHQHRGADGHCRAVGASPVAKAASAGNQRQVPEAEAHGGFGPYQRYGLVNEPERHGQFGAPERYGVIGQPRPIPRTGSGSARGPAENYGMASTPRSVGLAGTSGSGRSSSSPPLPIGGALGPADRYGVASQSAAATPSRPIGPVERYGVVSQPTPFARPSSGGAFGPAQLYGLGAEHGSLKGVHPDGGYGMVIGNFYRGHGYWDGTRFWAHRDEANGKSRYHD